MAGFVVRRVQEADLPIVSAMEKEIFTMPWSEQGFRDALAMPTTLFVVAEQGERIVGYCVAYFAADEAEIMNVAVSPDVRRQGIAHGMLEYVLSAARDAKTRHVVLEARVSNEPAIRLYERFGFRFLGVRKDYYEAPHEDGYVMGLRL